MKNHYSQVIVYEIKTDRLKVFDPDILAVWFVQQLGL